MKPTLFLLAAGMGSRYGGLKQLDGLGPSGETIMDYSIFDAIRGGFGKVVFVIRKDFEADFREKVLNKYANHIPVEVVFQSLDKLPEGFSCPADRVKPWGTNHAVLMAKDVIKEPFAVINADDFYGYDAFKTMADYLTSLGEGSEGKYCMVGYKLYNTLSDFGSVSRGECVVDAEGNLTGMAERLGIKRLENGTVIYEENGEQKVIAEDATVSMNMFGFTPDYFAHSERLFKEFLADEANMANPKSEFFIPLAVNNLINNGKASMRVLTCDAQWFGVTYKEDKPDVEAKIRALIREGKYPAKLW